MYKILLVLGLHLLNLSVLLVLLQHEVPAGHRGAGGREPGGEKEACDQPQAAGHSQVSIAASDQPQAASHSQVSIAASDQLQAAGHSQVSIYV